MLGRKRKHIKLYMEPEKSHWKTEASESKPYFPLV